MILYGRNSPYAFSRSLRPRHFCVLLLAIYVILEALVVAACTTSAVASYYLTSLTYTAYSSSTATTPITKFQLHMGYFSSCVKAGANGSLWSCGDHASELLLLEPSFDSDDELCVELYNLVADTGDLLRRRCMTPYVLLISIVASFFILVFMALLSPLLNPRAYKLLFVVAYVALALSVVAAIWQETNVKTANMLLAQILNDYYRVSADYGNYCRAAVWTGTGIQILISFCCLVLAIANSRENRFTRWWDYSGMSAPPMGGGPAMMQAI